MIGFVVLGIHARVTAVVEESAEGEFEESVHRMFAIIQRVVQLVVVVAVAQLVGNDGVEIGRVGGVADLGDVGRRFAAQTGVEVAVEGVEEGMRLQFAGAAASRSLVGRGAQSHDQIGRFRRQVSTVWNPQRCRPVYHLQFILK